MRKRFDKSPAIDAASNLRLVDMIQNHDGDYSARELEILEDGRKMIEVFEQQKSKELKMASHMTQAKMAFKDGESHAYGWSTAVVRASPAQVLAYVWDLKKRAGVYKDDLEKTIDEDGEHNKLMCVCGGSDARPNSWLLLVVNSRARQPHFSTAYPTLCTGTSRRRGPTRSTTGSSSRGSFGRSGPRGTPP
jgi:hypothetical protein